MIWLLIYIIDGVIFGFVSQTISANKGYDGGFAWGFFLGILGVIVVACKPMNTTETSSSYSLYASSNGQHKEHSTTISRKPDEILGTVYSNQQLKDGPLAIKSCEIKRDQSTNLTYLSCVFLNSGEKRINALLMDIDGYDPFDTLSDSIKGYSMLDINAEKQTLFGKNEKIILPSGKSRKCLINIRAIILEDGIKWENEETIWEPLSEEIASISSKPIVAEDGYIICPKCGQRQRSVRTACYQCGIEFE